MADMADPDTARAAPSLSARIVSAVKSIFRRPAMDESLRESLEGVIGQRAEAGNILADEERHMLVNILSFGERRVDDVMVPRADIIAVEEQASLEDVLRVCYESAHSRLPIYRETLDNALGMVHIKDLLRWLAPGPPGTASAPFSLRSLRRNILFVPSSMRARDLLLKMQTTRIHLALVVDEYGGIEGLVSIEDLVEEIVGDIEDEHDTVEGPLLIRRVNGVVEADARAPIEDLEEMFGVTLISQEDREDMDTLGGLVFSLVGRVPLRGELIVHPEGLEFEVRDADPRRIKRLRIHKTAPAPPSGHEAAQNTHDRPTTKGTE